MPEPVKTRTVERLEEFAFVTEGKAKSLDEMGHDGSAFYHKRAAIMREAAREIERLQASHEAMKEALRKITVAAEHIKAMKFDRIRKRNGHETSVEADDGEKCWIVHSDHIGALEFASEQARAALKEAEGER